MIEYLLVATISGFVGLILGWFICALLTVSAREDAWAEGYHVGCLAKSREEA